MSRVASILKPNQRLLLSPTIGAKRGCPVDLKAIKSRRKTVKTIGKLCHTMKVMASSKMTPALDKAREVSPFFGSINAIVSDLTKERAPDSKIITVIIATDKGLCGATNNNLTRTLLKQKDLENQRFIVWGDKGCGALENSRVRKNVIFSAHPNPKHVASFQEIGVVVDEIMKHEYDYVRIYFNQMESKGYNAVISEIWLPSYGLIKSEKAVQFMNKYELDSIAAEEMLLGLHEFHLSSALNYALYQNIAVEMFNRRNSMESASKNATELVGKLTLKFNRGRQAAITTELCEITAGKAAQES